MLGRVDPEDAALVARSVAMIVHRRHANPLAEASSETALPRRAQVGNWDIQVVLDHEPRPAHPSDDRQPRERLLGPGYHKRPARRLPTMPITWVGKIWPVGAPL